MQLSSSTWTIELSGQCVQKMALNVSSTKIREIMARGRIPGSYGVQARKLINAVVYRMQQVASGNTGRNQAHAGSSRNAGAKGQSAALPSVTRLSANTDAIAKAMPKRQQLNAQLPRVPPPPADVTQAANRRPIQLVEAAALSASSAQHQASQTQAQLAECKCEEPQQLDSCMTDPQTRVSEAAQLLHHSGVMKLSKPLKYNLSVYWHTCVIPLCAVLRVHPVIALRRCSDTSVRVPYFPMHPPFTPILVVLDVESFVELRMALTQVGGTLVSLWYISLDFVGMTPNEHCGC
eukprot:6480274-Amphidinium_carterae.2